MSKTISDNRDFNLLADEVWVKFELSRYQLEADYFISNMGRIARHAYVDNNAVISQLVPPYANHVGDMVFTVYNRLTNRTVSMTVKKAVIAAFGTDDNGISMGNNIRHNNGDKTDNRIGNLFVYCKSRVSDQKKRINRCVSSQMSPQEVNTLFVALEKKYKI